MFTFLGVDLWILPFFGVDARIDFLSTNFDTKGVGVFMLTVVFLPFFDKIPEEELERVRLSTEVLEFDVEAVLFCFLALKSGDFAWYSVLFFDASMTFL